MLDEFETSDKPRTRGRSLIASLVAVSIVFGGLGAGYLLFRDSFNSFVGNVIGRFTVEDYDGPPGPETIIVIEEGDNGEDVARKLLDADVIKSFDAIYRDMLNVDLTIYPGHYSFPTQIVEKFVQTILNLSLNFVALVLFVLEPSVIHTQYQFLD